MEKSILLVIAAYLRKANHPLESDEEIAEGVILDLKKVNNNLAKTDARVFEADKQN